MTDSISPLSLTDDALRTAQTALDGLALRQEMIGRNIANVDTPGYRAQNVSFENTLQRAQGDSQVLGIVTTRAGHLAAPARPALMQVVSRRGGSVRADDNNVDIDRELTEMAETGIRFQALTQLVSKKLLLLKSIATGR
ncbi:MAG: flagellar basal body rod protein FlgB [Chloroflexi bacterium]|nr:flagellar basal body rod protein FlgB [Chloroflexota bacterium]